MTAHTEKMYDLGIEFSANGDVMLEQDAGCGERAYVQLHPCQLRLIAERAGLIDPDAQALPRGLLRRLERLRAMADDLFVLLDSVPCYPPGSGQTEDVARAGDLLGALDDLIGDHFPEEETMSERHDNVTANAPPAGLSVPAPALSVTPPPAPRPRGRPRKPDALTPAERQARHRAKRASLELETTS